MNYVGRDPAPGGLILVGDTNPVGAIVWGHKVPDGSYLQLNGQTVSKTTYADLWAYAGSFLTADQTANPGLYLSVDASTFKLPKLDGLFVRGTGQFDGNRVAAALGVRQDDTVGPHTHTQLLQNLASSGSVVGTPFNGGPNPQSNINANTGTTEARPINVALIPSVKALRTVLMPSTAMPTRDLEFVSETNIASGTVNVDIPLVGYAYYRLMFSSIIPLTNDAQLCVRASTNGGSSFDSSSIYSHASSGVDTAATARQSAADNLAYMPFMFPGQSNDANRGMNGEMITTNPATAQRFAFVFQTGALLSTNNYTHMNGANEYKASGVVNYLRFFYSSGNFRSGRISLYGMRTP